MPNPGQPTISPGATGEAVRQLQRALRRTPNLGLVVNGVFGPATATAVKEFQQGAGLVVDGIVEPQTWAALPNGAPMPTLREGSTGAVVTSLQQLLSNGASGQWNTSPGAIDGNFGPATAASVKAFQTWGGVTADGIVGDQTWAVSLHAASATLESAVGLRGEIFIDGRASRIRSPHAATRLRVELLTEDRKYDGLAMNLDGAENISGVALPITAGFVGYGEQWAQALRIARVLRLALRAVRSLSGGNQQKAVLAKWLARVRASLFSTNRRAAST